jgi:acyl carrier protein
MDLESKVLETLDSVLGLGGRTRGWTSQTPLLGAVPELDSMAVVSLLTALSDQFDLSIDDDDIGAATFASVGALVEYVRGKIPTGP